MLTAPRPSDRSLRLLLAGALAVGAGFLSSAAAQQAPKAQAPAPQQAPPAPRVVVQQLDAAMLDRWIKYAAVMLPAGANAEAAKTTEAQLAELHERTCKAVGLPDPAQCGAVDDYVAFLLAGLEEPGNRFVDPVAKARQDLAGAKADKALDAKAKAEAVKDIEEFLARAPQAVPKAHIDLMNASKARILPLLQTGR